MGSKNRTDKDLASSRKEAAGVPLNSSKGVGMLTEVGRLTELEEKLLSEIDRISSLQKKIDWLISSIDMLTYYTGQARVRKMLNLGEYKPSEKEMKR
jgi:hypothetical protein